MINKNQHDLVDLRLKYKVFLNADEVEKLELELQKPNIFSILGIGRMEIRHSNFLAWLLDPNASHGLSNRFLIRVLRDLSLGSNNDLEIVKINRLNFSNVEVKREYWTKNGSIDLLINFKDKNDELVICIENKTDTTDFEDQLNKYETYINGTFKDYKKVFVYLTPDGSKPVDTAKRTTWHFYSYREIIEHIEDIQKTINDSIIKTYISDYLTILNLEIMGTQGEAQDLANAIYKNHRTIIDFVNNTIDISAKYKQIWEEADNKRNVFSFAEKMFNLIEETDQTGEYDLNYTQNAITIRRKNNSTYLILYYLSPRDTNGLDCKMEFSFPIKFKENSSHIKKMVKDIVDKSASKAKNKDIKWTDGSYFNILSVNKLDDDVLKEIHKIRFGID